MSDDTKLGKAAAPKRKPPNAGKGRPPGTPNKSTAAVKDALLAVYADLQAKADEGEGAHRHLLAWAQKQPGEFYKLWAKMLPTEVSGPGGGPVETRDLTNKFAALPASSRQALRAAIGAALNQPEKT